ncbi:flagellar motility protein MotE (MotC chaperone) [Rhodopseudomonas thermotolerans]|jgi:flagellar motility protein MotE (MotC chaperone)|uniref:Flagellar motility protein MotE (MotC chaperone) n=2 Tax=Rhodopseudomonas TaxID=1073 RepID=A0A336JMX0_9BRAD|nr:MULTISPECIES: flagellar protein FlbB [Rhodopseudomonas]RED38148.1 flagellar motility protein MotE (MotC chaperone) [Rhodopseudomonas pentothenatexigens]REG05341.1 flagellar motility protein MotE (MotC chaperone) [Rhodopseudomonas thermotolerans]SSW90173.1 flagellar motility protein MotE (MotC chaperone) [Rhodopseudomonas pentothenatexigens]
MNAFRDIRILPVVLVAVFGLAVLKIAGLVLDGGYVFDYDPNATKPSWAQDNLNFPGRKPVDPDITGSVASAPKKKEEEPKPAVAAPEQTKPAETEPETPPISASERAILERLQARRQELEARAREVEIRESLLKAAEKRIESKVQEMKQTEGQIGKANEEKSEADAARFKGIVTMYESMKPKDAAKIFDRLEMPVLIEIATQIAPRKMSDILGLMTAEAAEKLTVEMARRATGKAAVAVSNAVLPKIEGRPMPRP